jgi:5-methylcytosine-specific restriction endonuclease McrA
MFKRTPNTTSTGHSFDLATKIAVWNKATIVPGINPSTRRKDTCGAWIEWANYGDTTSNGTGWEIDHIHPVARGGSDQLVNLQPLQWQNNRCKSDGPAANYCAIKAAA